MKPNISNHFIRLLRTQERKSLWTRMVAALAVVVVIGVAYTLMLPAITMENQLVCGLPEHVHTEECYAMVDGERVLVCGLTEHVHSELCLAAAQAEAEALSQKVRGLLPDAMTAGLSAAYLANRKMEEDEQSSQLKMFKRCIKGMMALALLPIAINLYLWLYWNKSFADILSMLPREVMYILPIYIPLFWLAVFANKRVNLSKRLIEEYKHKEAVSKTYEGLSKQIDELGNDAASRELKTRLLYNTVMLSEKNPGELIKNFNRPDNPLLDVLNQGAKFSEAIANLKQFPGFEGIVDIAKAMSQKPPEPQRTKSDNEAEG